jgi:hypothetical protein
MKPNPETPVAAAVAVANRPVVVAILAAAVLLAGCAPSISEVMESWLGHHRNELLASWGPPTQVLSDGAAGEIWVYRYSSTYVLPGTSTTTTTANARGTTYWNSTYVTGSATSTTISTPARVATTERTRTFWINARGVIYRYHWQGV